LKMKMGDRPLPAVRELSSLLAVLSSPDHLPFDPSRHPMHQSFVNLNAVRRRAAAQTAAELEQKRLQQEQEQLTPPNQVDLSSSPSSALVDASPQPPLTLISSASPSESPLDNPVTIASNLLVRRYHTTANSKPSRLVHPQRVREEGEDDSSLSRMASGLAIDQVEEDDAVIVVERDGKLYRHGSLPARFERQSFLPSLRPGAERPTYVASFIQCFSSLLRSACRHRILHPTDGLSTLERKTSPTRCSPEPAPLPRQRQQQPTTRPGADQ
jgi:hypothetical protein